MTIPSVTNAMTVDVEDYFQVSAFENSIDRNNWNTITPRVEANIDRVLGIFENTKVTATFFILGWVAEKHPQLVKSIHAGGHEVASHGYSHIRVTQQNVGEFREDITRTKKLLEDISGSEIKGYRAASFSINAERHWAHQELESAGYHYSSSVYPIVHDHYGVPEGELGPYAPNDSRFVEIPITAMSIFGRRVPCGGGGYFRLFPYPLSSWLIQRVNAREKRSCVFYFHPWEIDAEQPRMNNISLKTRFRHYNGLSRMEPKLRKLAGAFRWGRMDRLFL